MQILWIPLLLLALFGLELYLYQTNWSSHLRVTLHFPGQAVTEGETSILTEEITNRNFLPFPLLQVHYQLRLGLTFSPQIKSVHTDRTTLTDIFSLGFYEKRTRDVEIIDTKRGYYTILDAQINTDDLFHLRHFLMDTAQDTAMYVYPKCLDGEQIEVTFQHILGDVLSRRFLYEDPFTFRGIREYRAGDPERSVNWKASARSTSLQVNVHDHTAGQQVMLLLNLEAPAILYSSELLENGIRLARTYAELLMEQQIPTGLSTNGMDVLLHSRIRLEPGSTGAHRIAFAQALARIDLLQNCVPFATCLREVSAEAGDATQMTYVLISSATGDALCREAARLSSTAGGLLWICPLTAGLHQAEVNIPGVTFLPVLFH